MFLGIDLGTSGIKVIMLDAQQNLIAQNLQPLTVSRPQPLFSEQHPHDWWQALNNAMKALSAQHPQAMQQVQAIGLSGQMHGAVLLDNKGNVIRPAILWNDGRSFQQCHWLEENVNQLQQITGNAAMPGFTAPKLLWVKQHEPDAFARVQKVLLPKDYLRFCMTGDFASDMSDSAGTLWLNVAKRIWSDEMLAACDLTTQHMPLLFEGNEVTGMVRDDIAVQWGIPANTPVVAGGGDNAAGAMGSSVVNDGQTLLSIGTSGVIFTSSNHYKANPAGGVHSFCHAVADRWHQMSVILSAASCFNWGAKLTGTPSVNTFMALAQNSEQPENTPIFLPYLSGERTPHNNPNAQGVLFGLTHDTSPADIARAIVEGVAFAFADGYDALNNLPNDSAIDDSAINDNTTSNTASKKTEMVLIGGGTKSALLSQTLADALNVPMIKYAGSEVGPALGAARLAMLSRSEYSLADVCVPNQIETRFEPDANQQQQLQQRLEKFRRLYPLLESTFN